VQKLAGLIHGVRAITDAHTDLYIKIGSVCPSVCATLLSSAL